MASDGLSFTPEQVAYLNGLDAVATCDGRRIVYTDEFRSRCLERYRQGVTPTELFREAGLDPQLVGRKRISRAFARWRRSAGVPGRPTGRPRLADAASSADSASDAVVVDPRDEVIGRQAELIVALQRLVASLERELAEARASHRASKS